MKAACSCDLPRNRKQVYNLQYQSKCSEKSSNPGGGSDVLSDIMYMCKETESTDHKFIR